MTNYFIVDICGDEIKLTKVPDNYWFSNPVKKEGYKHKFMVETSHLNHWKNSKSLSYSVSCSMYVYTYGDKKPLSFGGWTFYPDRIRSKYALTNRFSGMEMWFVCMSPDGEKVEWYCNFHNSANHEEFIKHYFEEIIRISKYGTIDEARKHTYNDPFLRVFH
jgi:hypothetical protein